MLALRKPRPEAGVALEDVAEPRLDGANDVMIEVAAAGICGTDLHIDHWAPGYHHLRAALPLTLGHEFVGRVVDRAPGTQMPAIGQRVTVVPATSCGTCAACLAADHDSCRDRRGIGVLRDGGFARFVAVPARNCIPLPDALPDHVAALTEPIAIGVNAVATGTVRAGERVLVLGPGTIGQAIALIARRAGAVVTVVGRDDAPRLAVMRDLGFDDRFDTAVPEAASRLAELADSFDCVFEASGARAAFHTATAFLKPAGRLVVVGIHGAPGEIDLVRLVRKRLRILGSFSSPATIWPGVVETLARDPALFARMVTHRVALQDIMAGFTAGHRREASKVVVHPT